MSDPFGPKKKYRSVSQVNQYNRCPHAFFLDRLASPRAWKRPAAWLPQGTAVHAAIEAWEASGRTIDLEAVQAVFREEFAKEVNRMAKVTPNFDWWSASGPYRGAEDIERRFGIGIDQCAKYLKWALGHPEEVIWITPDGTPAIELEFDIDLDGIPVRGYIDAIVQVEISPGVWELRVRDHKTGNNPGDDFQLGVYGVAVADTYGVGSPKSGDYWMARPGKPTHPFDLTVWTRDAVAEKFRELEENIRNERFEPNPDPDRCKFCDVSYACEYRAG